jgi:serine/threonine protein kinase
MKDREFLKWLHERLEHVHGESPIVDYMHKLRAIIRDTPPDRVSINCNTGNKLEDLP